MKKNKNSPNNSLAMSHKSNSLHKQPNRIFSETEPSFSEQFVYELLEKLNSIAVVIDTDYKVVFCNSYLLNFLGFKQKEIIGSNWLSHINSESKSSYLTGLKNGKIDIKFTCTIVSKNGGTHLISWSNTIIKNSSGNIIGMSSVGEDVVELKKTVLKTAESENRFHNVLEDLPNLICCFLPNLEITFVNENYSKYFNKKVDELIGTCFLSLIPKSEREYVKKNIDLLTPKKSNIVHEHKVIAADGRIRWQKWTNRLIYDENGKKISYQAIGEDITESKQNELDLKDSRNKLAAIFNNTTDYQLLLEVEANNTFKIVAVNKSYLEGANQFGIKIGNNDLVGLTLKDAMLNVFLFDKEIVADITENYIRVSETKEKMEFIEDLRINDNEYYAEISLIPILDSQENCQYVLYNSHDISNTKKSEKLLRESEERLRLALKSANQGLYDLNVQTGNAVVSSEYAKMLGYNPKTFTETNKRWIDRLHPDDYENTSNAYTEYIEGVRDEYKVEFRQKTRQGQWIWILSVGSIVEYDAEGNPLRMLGTHTNITERKQAEVEVRKQLLLNRLILNTTMDGYILADTEGKIIEVNPAYCNLIGYTHDELVKMNIRDLEVKIPKEEIERRIQTIIDAGKDYFETLHKHRNGNILDLEVSISVMEVDGSKYLASFIRDITERKQAEEKLKESEGFLRGIFENSLNAIMVADDKGNYTSVNKAASAMFGYGVEEMLRMNVEHINSKNSPDAQKYKIYLEKGQEIGEFKFSHANGECRVAQYHAVRVRENFNLSILSDITDSKLAEIKIKESESNLKALINNTDDSIWALDCNYNYITFNKTYADIFLKNYGFEVKKGLNAKKQLTSEELKFWIPLFENAFNGKKEVFEFSHEINGIKRHFQTLLNPIYESDTITGVSARSVDITERKKDEELLKKQTNELNILNTIGNKVSSTLSVEQVLDLGMEEIRKTIDADVVLFFMRKGDRLILRKINTGNFEYKKNKSEEHCIGECLCGKAVSTGKSIFSFDITADLRCTRSDCKMNGLKSLAAFPLHGGGEVIGSITIGSVNKRNFEDLKTFLETFAGEVASGLHNAILYEKLTTYSTNLEKQVADRTSKLVAANEELETFTYSVSHDLKAPLRGINGYSKLLYDTYKNQLNEEANTFLINIRDSALKMNKLIDDLLEYSRLERSQIVKEKIKVRHLLDSIILNYRDELEDRKFKIDINIGNVVVFADLKGLTIAIRNLVENAIKFTKGRKKPAIYINMEEKSFSWILSFKDNGIGFDKKYKKKIFEIFQRLHKTEEFPGTGIGLAMVQKAMQRMKGKSWAESVPDRGSTFYLEIPKSL